jgi:hypothetical protein
MIILLNWERKRIHPDRDSEEQIPCSLHDTPNSWRYSLSTHCTVDHKLIKNIFLLILFVVNIILFYYSDNSLVQLRRFLLNIHMMEVNPCYYPHTHCSCLPEKHSSCRERNRLEIYIYFEEILFYYK